MRRWISLVVLCLVAASIFAARYRAHSDALRVNESSTRFSLQREEAVVSLALENPGAANLTAEIKLELLSPRNVIRARAESEVLIPSGAGVSKISLTKIGAAGYNLNELLWHRLRYRIELKDAEAVTGIISLSEITPDIFRLLVSAPQEVGKEAKYTVRVRTHHPLTGAPLSGVKIEAEMAYEGADKEHELKTSGITDSLGEALVEFRLPGPLNADEVELKVTAERGGCIQEASEQIDILRTNQIFVSTDKPLYQPGQTLHVRVLAFDRDQKAWANTDGTLKIRDPEGTYVFRANFRTSRFGVADVDWPTPDSARLGDYYIEVWLGEEGSRNAPGGLSFKISRYDLPNFAVSVTPNRGYYLPGQNAEVTVRADYLFGQPVKQGRVRIVRETERRWDFREQKWKIEEGKKYEGVLDEDSRFVAKVNLEEEHQDFKPDSYSRFRDLRYAAHLTDLTTGRTEQRRFDLRITSDSIHVYLIERGQSTDRAPLQFYISTSYADGTPAACEVTVSQTLDDVGEKSGANDSDHRLLALRTNRYGVAKVASLKIAKPDDGSRLHLKLIARDGQDRSGQTTHTFWVSDSEGIRVEADKPLYRAGEPIRARLLSSSPHINWTVDLMRGYRLLATRIMQLKEGRAEIVFPFNQEFSGELMIVAYPAFGDDYDSRSSMGWTKLLYPRDRELKLDVAFSRTSYRPGDEALADFEVRTPNGRAAQSALGVVIFDKAIEERARTDQEFGGRNFGFYDCFRGALGDSESIAGITRRGLERLNLSKPLPDGMELVAEILLNQGDWYYRPRFFSGHEFETNVSKVFGDETRAQLRPVESALDFQQNLKSVYPMNETMLRRQLLLAGVDLDDIADPWGTAYRLKFSSETIHDTFEMISAGPDKRFDTDDDFSAFDKSWLYFRYTSEAIARAAENYYAKTGTFIRDRATLRRELLEREAIDIDLLRDRWEKPYKFEFGLGQRNFSISVSSGGANRRFENDEERWKSGTDDFTLSTCLIDYTIETNVRIGLALSNYFQKTGLIPQNDGQLRQALNRTGLNFDELRDGWGNRYYATFKSNSRYSNRVTQYDHLQPGEKPRSKTEITPVTEQLMHITIRSAGADGRQGTTDDFDIAEFSRVIAETSAKQLAEKIDAHTKPKAISFPGEGGVLSGTVTDPQGAIIPNVTVTAKHVSTGSVWTAKTNNQGSYFLRDLAPGTYEVKFEALGFKLAVFVDIAVYASKLTRVDAALNAGAVSETVTVSAAVPQLMTTTSASVATVVRANPSTNPPPTIATPRLRQYFPETLLWQPQIETNKQGRAQLKFKLADNITTWKMSVVGSTLDGEIGIAEKEFRAFQPFFAEHDPPKVLTEGDEIALPVVLRNYLDKSQSVNAEIKPEIWFELLGPGQKRAMVNAGEAGQVVFDFRAIASVKEGKQRITAFGIDASDAIEKGISVHPDGEEITVTASTVFSDRGSLEINIPQEAIKNSTQTELKIYPNLMAHALEGIEGILRRPYGCAEQTISSTYPNVMALGYIESHGENLTPSLKKLAEKARRFTRMGYDRLLGYRTSDGGFGYWEQSEPDLPLTAYALRFLSDARKFVAVDENVIEEVRDFILKRQQPDGRWNARYRGEKEDETRTALNTAFIARVLAMNKKPAASGDKAVSAALGRAFDYLAQRAEKINEPYLLASYALAAIDAGETAVAAKAAQKLQVLAREEAGTSYWGLESYTPFYGWGLAGRIETTALAVTALKRAGSPEQFVDRGLLFLLRNKDRYGVWLSTHATINVLDALLTLNKTEKTFSRGGQAEIIINGRRAASVAMPPGSQVTNAITSDISQYLSRGNNLIEIRRAGDVAKSSAQIVETHYVPWKSSATEDRENIRLRESSALRLAVRYDKTEAAIGEAVTCSVVAERIATKGYGMLLAEIGLPPGADVDRASLEEAMKASVWELNHYDVMPDRVVVYLWPRAGGTEFSFKFKLRYGVNAQTAPSGLYDYYNPEARAVVAPARFVVR